jgi:hypothetical protein
MRASAIPRPSGTPFIDISPPSDDHPNLGDEERGLPIVPHAVPLSVRSLLSNNPDEETELQPTRPASATSSSSANYLKRKTSQIYDAVISNGVVNIVGGRTTDATGTPLTPALVNLVDAYARSDIAAGIKADGEQLRREVVRTDNGDATGGAVSNELPDVVLETSILRGRKRASWSTQFRILSGRAFKNLYRDPALLAAHYLSAIALAGTFHCHGYGLLS